MTIIQDIKALDVRKANCNNNTNYSTGVLNMKCCSNGSTSNISVDKISIPSTSLVAQRSSSIKFPPCKRVDLEFEDVKYTVRKFSFAERNFITKEILHGINGSFHSGQLSAIMGPSGSGKSTLLNVLSGFRTAGFDGAVRVNGMPVSTSSKKFRELSCYIQQDDALRPQLTVNEVMMLGANLKLGYSITKQQKQDMITHILAQLNLSHRTNVYGAKLSGGQKRRLAIALELISNPPVLYLDEPTSGLDSSSCSKCVQLLKKLASQGHTIVCTIHQPSAMIFEMFDKLYTIVGGYCIYQGSIPDLIPFLSKQNLLCPTYHNPADFLLEVAVGDHGSDVNKLIEAATRKHIEDFDLNQQNRIRPVMDAIQEDGDFKMSPILKTINNFFGNFALLPWDNGKLPDENLVFEVTRSHNSHDVNEATTPLKFESPQLVDFVIKRPSFFVQYFLLLRRNLLCARRNYRSLGARLLSHLLIAIIFGYLYQNVGEKANTVLGNYVYIYGTTLLLLYTGKMAVILTFPLEIKILKREHFNRWYNLAPYLLAILSFEIPFQCLCALSYLTPSAYLTNNNRTENARIYYFLTLSILLSLSAQAWGFFIGANLPIKLAIFLGPILGVLFSVFGFCTRYIDINPLFRWMWHISYFRAAFHGSLNAIYGMGRSLLPCPKEIMYCHFRSPKVFLNFMMINEMNMRDPFVLMFSIIIIMHLMTMLTLWHKINKR